MNSDKVNDEASGHVFRATRFAGAEDILGEIDNLLEHRGTGYQDRISYNPDDDPIYKITIKVERL